MAYTLQLKRNVSNYSDKDTALVSLKSALAKAAAGEALIATYTDTKNPTGSILLGIAGLGDGKFQIFEGVTLDGQGKVTIPESVKEYLDALDAEMPAGNVVTKVTQTDGLVAVEAKTLASADGSVVVGNDLDLKVNIDGETIVLGAGGKLSVAPAATKVTGKDAIKVTDQDGKQVELVIAAANQVLSQNADGLTTTLKLNWNSADKKVELQGIGDAVISSIDGSDFVVDGMLEKVELVENSKLKFTFNTDADKEEITIDLAQYIKPYTNGNGLNLEGQEFSVKVKDGDEFITVDANGVASKGVNEAIAAAKTEIKGEATTKGDTLGKLEALITALEKQVGDEDVDKQIDDKIAELDYTDEPNNDQYVSAVNETDGVISVARKNILAAAQNGKENALQLIDGSLYLSVVIDCGNY